MIIQGDMFYSCVKLLSEALSSIIQWFTAVLETAGMTGYYLAAVFLMLLARFILYPTLGSAIHSGASDRVSRYRSRRNARNRQIMNGRYDGMGGYLEDG